jgi:hypothetical protein
MHQGAQATLSAMDVQKMSDTLSQLSKEALVARVIEVSALALYLAMRFIIIRVSIIDGLIRLAFEQAEQNAKNYKNKVKLIEDALKE